MNNIIKVLHILWSGQFGGAEKVAKDVALYSTPDSSHHILCFLSHGFELEQRCVDMGIETYSLKMNSGFSLLKSLMLLKIIKKCKPNFILFHKPNFASGVLSLFFSRIARVYFEHGADLVSSRPIRDIAFYKLFKSKIAMIFSNSNFTKTMIINKAKVKPEKIKVVRIGIDTAAYGKQDSCETLRKELGIKKDDHVIGIVGRLVEQKGIDDFIRVSELINKRISNCVFLIVGDGIERTKLKKMASECEARILFMGERSDIPQVISAFSIFLMTSRWEPYGIVVLEALASGIPVVGFRIPGMSEIVERSKGSILIDNRNLSDMADTTVRLLKDTALHNKLSEEGYVNIRKHFDVRTTVKEIETLLRSIKD